GEVAIRGGTILGVGDSATLARYVGGGTRVIDARGGLVAPGFADGHTHFISGGFQLASIDLRDAATPQEFVRRIKEYAARLRPGEWLQGGDWDHTLWRGAPRPRPKSRSIRRSRARSAMRRPWGSPPRRTCPPPGALWRVSGASSAPAASPCARRCTCRSRAGAPWPRPCAPAARATTGCASAA